MAEKNAATSPIRTRFAPSPSGFLHIGSARTALFNWAYARRHGGQYVLRIEDTDQQRSTEESERQLLDGLSWLGIDWDEGPFRQSDRGDRHREAVARLLETGGAYRCICTRDELEVRRQETIAAGGKWTYDGLCRERDYGPDCGEHTVRIRLAGSGLLGWDDLVFGASGQDASEIGDRIIARADGSALYHLAGVVDDIDMQITHVIRGADHLPNTPLHVAIYRALDAEPPAFAHVPLILGESGKKLSKRRDPVSVQQFRENGFVADALRNWIVRLGWSHGDQEVFSGEEISKLFDLAGVGRSGARADADKLAWLNHHYIQEMPLEALVRLTLPFLADELDRDVETSEAVARLIDLNRQRGHTLRELAGHTAWLLREPVRFDPKAARKNLTPEAGELLHELAGRLSALEDWTPERLEPVVEGLAAEKGLKMGRIAQPVRVALTGGTISPGIYETLEVAGRQTALNRIEAAATHARLGEFQSEG